LGSRLRGSDGVFTFRSSFYVPLSLALAC